MLFSHETIIWLAQTNEPIKSIANTCIDIADNPDMTYDRKRPENIPHGRSFDDAPSTPILFSTLSSPLGTISAPPTCPPPPPPPPPLFSSTFSLSSSSSSAPALRRNPITDAIPPARNLTPTLAVGSWGTIACGNFRLAPVQAVARIAIRHAGEVHGKLPIRTNECVNHQGCALCHLDQSNASFLRVLPPASAAPGPRATTSVSLSAVLPIVIVSNHRQVICLRASVDPLMPPLALFGLLENASLRRLSKNPTDNDDDDAEVAMIGLVWADGDGAVGTPPHRNT